VKNCLRFIKIKLVIFWRVILTCYWCLIIKNLVFKTCLTVSAPCDIVTFPMLRGRQINTSTIVKWTHYAKICHPRHAKLHKHTHTDTYTHRQRNINSRLHTERQKLYSFIITMLRDTVEDKRFTQKDIAYCVVLRGWCITITIPHNTANLRVLHERQFVGCMLKAVVIIVLHSDWRHISTQPPQQHVIHWHQHWLVVNHFSEPSIIVVLTRTHHIHTLWVTGPFFTWA